MLLQVRVMGAAMKDPVFVRDDIEAAKPKRDVLADRRHSFLELGWSSLERDRHVKTSPLFKIT